MHEKDVFDLLDDDSPVLIMNGTKTYPDPNYFYFSGARFGGFENCALVVERSGTRLITMELEADAARQTGCDVLVYRSRAERQDLIIDSIGDAGRIYINAAKLNTQHYMEIREMFHGREILDCSAAILSARMIKNDGEIANIKESARISSRAIENAWSSVHEGMTEREFASSLVHHMMELGSALPQCEPTVAFGENTAYPHFQATGRKLKRGDLILADFNALFNKYTSDLTRTAVFGKASEKQQRMHDAVLEANEAGRREIRDGIASKEIEGSARSIIDATPFRGTFIHSLGHGIGLELHDHPAFGISSELVLRKNMAITVEPGVYLPGFGGIRIEDDVIVTEDGCTTLTDVTRELVEL